MFHPPVKTSYLPAENIIETPAERKRQKRLMTEEL